MECNRTLAGLLGWTEIVDLGGALLGLPPAGDPQCRGQALVPDWHGDWRDCGPLIEMASIDILCWWPDQFEVDRAMHVCADHASRDAAMRHAIVQAAINTLREYAAEDADLENSKKETP